MSLSLIFACAWVVVACVGAMFPSKRNHWPFAYVLMAVGVPMLGFVTYQHGPIVALVVFMGGLSILRWPVVYLWRWVKRQKGHK